MQIRVHSASECSQAVENLVKASYCEGCFPTRDGKMHRWLLDCRAGLSQSDILEQIIPLLSEGLANEDVHQAVGFGVGASFLIGGLVLHGPHDFRGGILRSRRKKYGAGKELEGDLRFGRKVAFVDDILNSGQTALRVVTRLRTLGFDNIIFLSILRFEWGAGATILDREGVPAHSLARITQRNCSSTHGTVTLSRRNKIYQRLRQWLRFQGRYRTPSD